MGKKNIQTQVASYSFLEAEDKSQDANIVRSARLLTLSRNDTKQTSFLQPVCMRGIGRNLGLYENGQLIQEMAYYTAHSNIDCLVLLDEKGLNSLQWRREWDSNPRYALTHTRFPSVLLKPLGHPSINLE